MDYIATLFVCACLYAVGIGIEYGEGNKTIVKVLYGVASIFAIPAAILLWINLFL